MPSEFCRYRGAGIGAFRRIDEGTCPKCDPQPKLLAAEINALPKRVRDFIHHLETDADPAGDKWRLAAAEENVAAVTVLLAELSTDAARWRYARANGLIYATGSFPLRGTIATPGRVGEEAADAFVDQQMLLGNGRALS